MFEEIKSRLVGPFYTVFTPFLQNEEIDYDCLGKYLDLLYRQGARRFYVMAYNSRYSQLKSVEILDLNRFCARTLKNLDKKNVVIVGDPIHCSTKESIEFSRHAKEVGADLISLIVREKYFSDEQILDHFYQVGRAASFPILVHEMPFLSGADGDQMHWPFSLLESLPQIKEIIAIKEDAKELKITRKVLELEPRIRVIIAGGGKRAFRNYLPFGAKAWLNGISIIDASIAEYFWQACKEQDSEIQDFVINNLEEPFFSTVVKKYGWHRTNKALLQAAGIMHRRDRMPLKHLSDTEFLEVQRVYDEINVVWVRQKELIQ